MADKVTKELVAQNISQPNAFDNDKTLEKQNSRAIFYKDKGYLKYNCPYWGGTTKKSFRQWEHPKNIIEGKKSQCGTTEKRYGSKNEIQHIGSPTGDIPRPAMLHLYNFKNSFINSSTKVHGIKISFDYRVINVTDKGNAWTENLVDSELAKIQGFQAWFGSWDQDTKLSAVKSSDKKLKYEGKNKNGYIWQNISFSFTDISASDILDDDFAFNLQFGMNCSKASTPCFLYINNLKLSVVYEESEIYIEGSSNTDVLYTSPEESCNTSIIHTIEAGYKKGNTKIPPNEAPHKLGKKIQVCNAPEGVTITKIQENDLTSQFQIIDKTNVVGKKKITYCLSSDPSIKVKLKYTAVLRPRPSYEIRETYKSQEDYESTNPCIIFKNGCTSGIKIYADSLQNTPLELTIANQNSTTNLLNQSQIQKFHTFVKGLPCGYHNLYVQRGNESMSEVQNNVVTVRIIPMEYRFAIYSETTPSLVYQQRKKGTEQNPRYVPLKIQRIDNEPRASIPSVSVIDETNLTGSITHLTDFKKDEIREYNIDLYYAGEFFIKVIEDNDCATQKISSVKVTVESTHKQNYDYLFTRGEDATTFDFKYLVAWEGDNIKTPISASDVELKHFLTDIRICSDSTDIGLSQIGTAKLLVTNLTEDDTFNNVKIELNTLEKNENDQLEVTTDEWIDPHGIFSNFYNLFYEFNLTDNVTVENLTPDNDLIDEENVYLHIKTIPPGDTVTIILPFRSTIEKTVFLQYLIFEQAQDIYYIGSCDSYMENPPNTISLSVIDSMQTQLDISGNTDLLNLDPTYDCPDECYSTVDGINEPRCPNDPPIEVDPQSGGITYTITNVDTNDFSQQYIQTEIMNSNELQPYGYYLDDQYYDFDNNTSGRVQWTQVENITSRNFTNQLIYAYIKFPFSDQEIMMERTNNKGVAKFFIQIPTYLNRSYTIKELLSEVLYFKFGEKDGYNSYTLAETGNTFAEYDIPKENKNNTIMTYTNNYRRYQPGQIAYIPITLIAKIKTIQNKITFQALLHDSGSSDQLTMLYRICNLENNQGVFKTTFKTGENEKRLIPQEISKNIYCGINSSLKIDSRLDKEIVEKENLNVLYLSILNKNKINKDVFVEIDLGQIDKPKFTGEYSFIDINIDVGDYAIREEDGRIIVTWLLGEMQEFQKNKAIVKIQAINIGLSDIQIYGYDYIHQKDCVAVIQQSKCAKCDDKVEYRIKNSPWKKFKNDDDTYTWYKLIDGVYQRRILNEDGELEWVMKE